MLKLQILLFVGLIALTQCYKILIIFPVPGPSHGFLGAGYVRALLEAGHEVTYASPFASKEKSPKLREIILEDNLKSYSDMSNPLNLTAILDKTIELDTNIYIDMFLQIFVTTMQNKELQTILRNPAEKFDVVIIEWLYSELYTGIAPILKAPFIWSGSTEPHWLTMRLIDEIPNPAYFTDIDSPGMNPLSFYERVQRLYSIISVSLYKYFFIYPKELVAYKQIFKPLAAARGVPLLPYDDVMYNASMMIGNSHVSLGEAMRLPSNYASIGGYHVKREVQPLPDDLKKIIESSKDGVIYFSMGSNLKSKDWPEVIKKDLLKMFGELKQTVLWKFEEQLPNVPKNVHILKWAPQPSILAHPNTKVFVTHCGLLSTTEAVHFGVPLVGIPVFADQFGNVARAAKKGFAKEVTLSYNLAADLKQALQEVITDPKYRNRAKQLSQVYHDRPINPSKELAFWVEHVVKTGGAPHFKQIALTVPWYQKLYLDLIGLILVFIVALKVLFSRLFRRNNKESALGKKKKN